MNLSHLNPAQRDAAQHTEGPALVLAGAGSGKTRVLTQRVAHLTKEHKVHPAEILAITFTNKAASEMKNRLESLGVPTDELWVSTFHAACVRILRQEINALGFSRYFVIYDDADHLSVIKSCLKELNIDDKKFAPRSVSSLIGRAKNSLQTPERFAELAQDHFQRRMAQIYELYQKQLARSNALDFDDLIMHTVLLFDQHPHVKEYYQKKFRYILVDEYQDTNHAQYVLVRQLAAAHHNLFVVGDPDQSIYRWRGADLGNILDFEDDYPDAKVFKLEQNYRSTQTILDAANAVISHNVGRKEKQLWTANGQGEPLVYFAADDERDEALFVADQIKLSCVRGDRPYGHNAILYRTNAQSRAIEEVFVRVGLTYKIVGGTKFYERKEIKDLVAYLRLIQNPDSETDLNRVINVPGRGIGEASRSKLADFARDEGITLYSALQRAEEVPGVSTRIARAARQFTGLIEKFQSGREQLSVTDIARAVLDETGYRLELEQEKTVESETRLENINEFLSVTREFDSRSLTGTLQDFLAEITLISDQDSYADDEDSVVLMTFHSAKGLEFPVVFMVGMEEGIFPHARALFDNEQEFEEERRLCYVGLTRARERVFLTNARRRLLFGEIVLNPPSSFLAEIPEHLMVMQGFGRGRHHQEPGADAAPSGGRAGGGRMMAAGSNRADRVAQPGGGTWANKRTAQSGGPRVDFILGDKVEHRSWGVGVVVGVKGEGDSTELVVAFPDKGIKNLLVQYAPIRKIEPGE